MLPPKITVITPALNTGVSIETALSSVANQTYANIEHLIIDGASKDDTLPTIRMYQKKYKNIRLLTGKDRGIYHAMNKGLDLCTGDWIIFLGADDSFFNENLLTDLFEQGLFQEEHIIYGNVSVIGDTFWAKDGSVYDGPFELKKLFRTNICHQAILYPRSVIGQIGYYSEKYPISADWDYNLRCFAKYKFTYTDNIIAFFNSGGISMGGDDTLLTDFVNNIKQYFQLDPYSGGVYDQDSPFYYLMSCHRETEFKNRIVELGAETERLNQLIADQQTSHAETIATIKKEHDASDNAFRLEFNETLTNLRAEQEHFITASRTEHDHFVTNLRAEHEQIICRIKNENALLLDNLRTEHNQNINDLIKEHNHSASQLESSHIESVYAMKSGYEEIVKSQQAEHQASRNIFRQKETEFMQLIESSNQLIDHLNRTLASNELLFKEKIEKNNSEISNLKADISAKDQQIVTIFNSFTWKIGKILLTPPVFILRKFGTGKNRP